MGTISIDVYIIKGIFTHVGSRLSRGAEQYLELIHAEGTSLEGIWFEGFVFEHAGQFNGRKAQTGGAA